MLLPPTMRMQTGFASAVLLLTLFIGALVIAGHLALKARSEQQAQREEEGRVLTQAYDRLQQKATWYQQQGVAVTLVQQQFPTVKSLLQQQLYREAKDKLHEIDSILDLNYVLFLEEDRVTADTALQAAGNEQSRVLAAKKTQAVAAPISTDPKFGYSRIRVPTTRGTFTIDVVKEDVGSGVRVITDSGSLTDCARDCATLPLAQYVSRNGGFAGINGTYFCPPDYAVCAEKKNTFHWFVFNNQAKTFLNADKRHWSNAGSMFVFRPGYVQFFRNADAYGLDTSITGAIASFPTLVAGSEIVLDESVIDDKQRTAKGNRGGIGNKGNVVYLIQAKGASVPDLAAIMKALGLDNGINLDGGGSTALFYNGYKLGPSRSLPNAIILAR